MPTPLHFVRKGYFPKELPPSFTTTRFARAIDVADPRFPLKDATQSLKWTQLMSHSLARAAHVRRTLQIPNPCNYWALAKEIADSWRQLREHAKMSSISLSVPTLRGTQGRALQGFRHHDDYELVFESSRKAEEGKAVLQSILAEYGLHLNPLKTELVDLPTRLVSDWWIFVKQFDFSSRHDERVKVIEFFEETFKRKQDYPNDYVVAYAIGRIEHETISERAWSVVEPLLHQAVVAEPSAAHKFVRVLIRAKSQDRSVNTELLSQTIERMVLDHAPYGHASEVAWMLWIALMLKIELSHDTCTAVSQLSDSVVALLALDAHRRGLAANLDSTHWASLMTQDALDEEHWLLSYEARIHNWLPSVGGGDHVASHPIFAYFANKRVRFYTRMRVVSRHTVERLEETDAASYDEYEFEDDDDEFDEDVINETL